MCILLELGKLTAFIYLCGHTREHYPFIFGYVIWNRKLSDKVYALMIIIFQSYSLVEETKVQCPALFLPVEELRTERPESSVRIVELDDVSAYWPVYLTNRKFIAYSYNYILFSTRIFYHST